MGGRGRRSGLVATIALVGVVVAGVAGAGSRAVPARGTILISTTRAPDLHDELWVLDLRTGRRTNFSRNPTADYEPAVSPDGSVVAFVSDRGGGEAVWVRGVDGTGFRRLAGPFAERPRQLVSLNQLAWSPDGRSLGFVVNRRPGLIELRVVPARGGASRRVAAGNLGWAWDPTKPRVAIGHVDAAGAEVGVHDLSGRRVWRTPGLLNGWSPRGQLAASEPNRGRVNVVDPDGRVVRTLRGIGGSWSPDGRLLAVALGPRGIRLIDDSGRARLLSSTLSPDFLNPWSPDGRSLLARDRLGRLARVTLAGKVTALGTAATWTKWGPDGSLMVSEGSRLLLYGRGALRRFVAFDAQGNCAAGVDSSPVWLGKDNVLYTAGRHGQRDADVWNADRSGVRGRFLGATDWEATPVWRAKGDVAVYEHGDAFTHAGGCSGPYTPHLRLVEPDGTVQFLTQRRGDPYDGSPRWSPDGQTVAFERGSVGDSSQFGIVAVDVLSSEERRLTSGADHSLSWTGDGTSVVFQRGNGNDIRLVSPETGVVSPLARGRFPEAAPRGSLVAFVRDDGLWTVAVDGTGERRLATVQPVEPTPAFIRVGERPRWSPDGRRLALVERQGFLVVDAAGGNVRRVAAAGARKLEWSPDGRTLAFAAPVGNYSRGNLSSGMIARTELFVVPATGGRPTRLTNDYANVLGISWRP